MTIARMRHVQNVHGNPASLIRIPFASTWAEPRVLHAGLGQRDIGYQRTRFQHVHDVFHIVLVTKGIGTFLVDHKPISVKQGHLVIVRPGQSHTFMGSPEDSTEYSQVTFEMNSPMGSVPKLDLHDWLGLWSGLSCKVLPVRQVLSADRFAELHGTMAGIAQYCVSPGDVKAFNLQRQFLLLWQALAILSARKNEPHQTPCGPIQNAHDILRSNLVQRITLEELANKVHVSPNYLSRAFKALYGTTPIIFHRRLRLEAAGVLLRSTNQPIKMIAENTGFADEQHFSHCFRRLWGKSPGAWRHGDSSSQLDRTE